MSESELGTLHAKKTTLETVQEPDHTTRYSLTDASSGKKSTTLAELAGLDRPKVDAQAFSKYVEECFYDSTNAVNISSDPATSGILAEMHFPTGKTLDTDSNADIHIRQLYDVKSPFATTYVIDRGDESYRFTNEGGSIAVTCTIRDGDTFTKKILEHDKDFSDLQKAVDQALAVGNRVDRESEGSMVMDEGSSPAITEQKPTYSLSTEQLARDPELEDGESLPKYVYGDPITRKNLTPMFIQSFAISRGIITGQYLYLSWLQENTGFDVTATFTNLKELGGWDALSEREKVAFKDAFMSVDKPAHKQYKNRNMPDIDALGRYMKEGFSDLFQQFLTPKIVDEYKADSPNLKGLPKEEVFPLISRTVNQEKNTQVFVNGNALSATLRVS
jgi:hypothetical protein